MHSRRAQSVGAACLPLDGERSICTLPLLASACGRVVWYHVGLSPAVLHVIPWLERSIWYLPLFVNAGSRVVYDHVGRDPLELHVSEELGRSVRFFPLLASTGGRIVCDHIFVLASLTSPAGATVMPHVARPSRMH